MTAEFLRGSVSGVMPPTAETTVITDCLKSPVEPIRKIYSWTETLMKEIPHHMMNGLSLHYYTCNWEDKGSATNFGEDLYFDILRRCLHIEDVIDRHMEIMDRYDPEKKVALVMDEWGTWYNVEPGTNPGFPFPAKYHAGCPCGRTYPELPE